MSEENNFDKNEGPSSEPVYNAGNSTYETSNNYGSGKGQGKGLGIASMILGIVSIVGCCLNLYIGIICGIVAIVLGIIQIVKNESKGMAIAGIVCGAVGLILAIVAIIFAAAFISALGPDYESYLNQYLN